MLAAAKGLINNNIQTFSLGHTATKITIHNTEHQNCPVSKVVQYFFHRIYSLFDQIVRDLIWKLFGKVLIRLLVFLQPKTLMCWRSFLFCDVKKCLIQKEHADKKYKHVKVQFS